MPRVLLQRDAEMAALGRHLREVRQGAGRVMVVCGPAGIGKSSLLAAAADASGLRVLRASGSPLEQDAGWGIARQLFAPLRDSSSWTGAAAPARRALDADFFEPALAGDAMHAAAHGLTWLACGLADRAPTLLVVDDVHWADAPSLRWLVQLSRRLGDRPLGVLGAVRSGDPPASPGLLAELLAAASSAPVRPCPLGPEAVAALVGLRLPAAGPSFALACHAVTAGNPFLLGALLAHVVAEGIEPTDEMGARLGAFGPEQVARVLDRQLARLPSGAGDLARAFAVLGRAVPLRQAAALAGLDPATAALTADHLGEAGLLRRTAEPPWPAAARLGGPAPADRGTYALVHPLVAAALHEGMAPGERALWHARAAGVLASERVDPEVVALHLMRTEPARDPATVRALRRAAERAGRRGALESAEAFLRRALNEPPGEPGDEAEVRAELGLLLATQAGPEAAGLLREALDLASDPERRARLALAGGRALGLAGYFDDAFRLCRRGLERPDGVSPVLLGRIEAELIGNAWTRAGWLGEARLRLASPKADQLTAVGRVNEAWIALYDGRPVEETRALLDGANDDEEDRDSILGTSATIAMIACGDLDEARARCGALIDTARERGWLIALAHGGFLRAMAEVPAGRIDEAAEDARMAYEFKKHSSPPIAMIWSLLPLADVLIEQDELDEAARVLDQAVAVPGSLTAPMLWERRGRLRLAQHRPAEAHEALVRAAGEWQGLGMLHPAMATWRVDDCFALAELGEMRAARRLAGEHLASARQVGVQGPIGAGLRAAARVGEPVENLTAAVRLLDGSPFTLELVRALVDLGAAKRRAGHRAGAREPLTRALDLAARGGMRALADRARAELLAAGARPRRTACSGWDALTPAERRVATLAAEGCANREIAQQLFVTRRTVETHLTHVFQKLGVATRAELTTTRAAR
ncbi:AAA family ATPase [Actinoplanes sp. NPDC051411]|uniref:ATP-binding protein n=1 Tax=Actinoplanes sp. NPDC051411 TaxID=3155522 RepID=UPI00343900EC